MKIMINELRGLIREYIDEMSYGGLVGPAINAKPNPNLKRYTKRMSLDAVEKFHTSPLYLKKANAAFKHFPFEIWVQPINSEIYERFDELFGVNAEDQRYNILSVDEVIEYNREYKLPLNVEKIRSIVDSGGCVIFSLTGELEPNFLSTPWMIIHAMFDSSDFTELGGISSFEIETYMEDELGLDRLTDILPYMTMGSATSNKMVSEREIIHELCVQEVITTGGVQFKESGDSELDEKLEMLKQKIKSYNLREIISNQIRGKVVVVSVH